jgi:predicted membrane channel-forming protein YqfA (hemolysin III family)
MSAWMTWLGQTIADRQMSHGVVVALGWTLLHFCWQGAAVAALLALVLGALGSQRSQARYAAGCFALALMVLLPLATFFHLAGEELAHRGAVAHAVLNFDIAATSDAGAAGRISRSRRWFDGR